MIIDNDRSPLDASLIDATATIFILLGAPDSRAGAVHTAMLSKNWQPYQKFYLISDTTILTAAELKQWLNGQTPDCYVVLGGSVPKTVAQNGPVSNLLKPDNTPDILKIEDAMLSGDEL
jgi:hypothetical protein